MENNNEASPVSDHSSFFNDQSNYIRSSYPRCLWCFLSSYMQLKVVVVVVVVRTLGCSSHPLFGWLAPCNDTRNNVKTNRNVTSLYQPRAVFFTCCCYGNKHGIVLLCFLSALTHNNTYYYLHNSCRAVNAAL